MPIAPRARRPRRAPAPARALRRTAHVARAGGCSRDPLGMRPRECRRRHREFALPGTGTGRTVACTMFAHSAMIRSARAVPCERLWRAGNACSTQHECSTICAMTEPDASQGAGLARSPADADSLAALRPTNGAATRGCRCPAAVPVAWRRLPVRRCSRLHRFVDRSSWSISSSTYGASSTTSAHGSAASTSWSWCSLLPGSCCSVRANRSSSS